MEAETFIASSLGNSQVVPEKNIFAKKLNEATKSLKMTDGLLYALIYIFILTFICYPGLAVDNTIKFMLDWNNYLSWHFIFIQAVFNFMDTVGRFMGGHPKFLLSNLTIKIGSALRTIFLVTMLLIAFDVPPAGLFSSSWFVILNLMLFAFSNGYISTLCAVKAPQTVSGEAMGMVGGFIGIFISLGIAIGSLLAFGMIPIIKASPENG